MIKLLKEINALLRGSSHSHGLDQLSREQVVRKQDCPLCLVSFTPPLGLPLSATS